MKIIIGFFTMLFAVFLLFIVLYVLGFIVEIIKYIKDSLLDNCPYLSTDAETMVDNCLYLILFCIGIMAMLIATYGFGDNILKLF